MVIWLGWGNVVHGFLGKDFGKILEFFGEDDGRFHFFGCGSKLSGCGEFCYDRRPWNKAGVSTDDSIEGTVSFGMSDILVLGFIVEEFVKPLVRDNICVDMVGGFGQGFLEEGVVAFIVRGVHCIELLGLITSFRDGEGLVGPVDDGVGVLEPGES